MAEQKRWQSVESESAAGTDGDGANGRSRIWRYALLAFGVLVLAVVIAVVVFLALRASRNKPLSVAIYPGAQLVNSEKLYEGFDHLQYLSTDSFEEIEAFYAGQDGMNCERFYRTVQERPGQEPLKEGHIRTRCQIDRSALGVTQYATVTIQPVFDENENPTGNVVIDIQRYWGG